LLVVTLACGDAAGPPTGSVRIVPDTISLGVGEQLRVAVVERGTDGTERPVSADGWESASSQVAAVGAGGVVLGGGPGFTRITAVLRGQRVEAPVAVGKITYRNIDSAVVALYDSAPDRLAIRLPSPAVATDNSTMEDNRAQVPTRWISTAYVGARFYRFYLFPDGRFAELYVDRSRPLNPTGLQRVLLLIVDYEDTDIRIRLDQWKAAQDSVNGEHRSLARALGYDAPLVQFDNTNVLVARDSTGDPAKPDSVYATLRRLGYDPDAYDIVVSLGMTSTFREGWAFGRFTFVTCFWCPAPGYTQLSRAILDKLAWAVYHHEIGHLWGWEHGWGGGPEGTRIITDPRLFGWTDTDGDGVPEVIDPTPYGIAPADTAGLGSARF
jgi:hypothetical protein